jgi:hypothetical protein
VADREGPQRGTGFVELIPMSAPTRVLLCDDKAGFRRAVKRCAARLCPSCPRWPGFNANSVMNSEARVSSVPAGYWFTLSLIVGQVGQLRQSKAAQRLGAAPVSLVCKTTRTGKSPRCGAKTRQRTPCTAPAIPGTTRCRMHGGRALSGSASPRFKHGWYTKEVVALRREIATLIASSRGTLDELESRRWSAP